MHSNGTLLFLHLPSNCLQTFVDFMNENRKDEIVCEPSTSEAPMPHPTVAIVFFFSLLPTPSRQLSRRGSYRSNLSLKHQQYSSIPRSAKAHHLVFQTASSRFHCFYRHPKRHLFESTFSGGHFHRSYVCRK